MSGPFIVGTWSMPSGIPQEKRSSVVRKTQRIDILAVEICRVIRDVRKDHQAWIGIDGLQGRLGLDDLRTVDAALAFASAKGWLAIGGRPAHSVLLKQGAP